MRHNFFDNTITENTTWLSYDGRKTKLKDLGDTHLINIIYHVRQYSLNYPKILLDICLRIARERGFTDMLLNSAQVPHVGKDGHWYMWNYETHKMEQVGREARVR